MWKRKATACVKPYVYERERGEVCVCLCLCPFVQNSYKSPLNDVALSDPTKWNHTNHKLNYKLFVYYYFFVSQTWVNWKENKWNKATNILTKKQKLFLTPSSYFSSILPLLKIDFSSLTTRSERISYSCKSVVLFHTFR